MALRQDQRQVISQRIDPKLIMANAILQQTALELEQHIESELLENPALDVMERDQVCQGNCPNPSMCPICSRTDDPVRSLAEGERYIADIETFDRNAVSDEVDFDVVGNIEAEVTLQDHLRSLLRAAVSLEDYWIGEYIICSLDGNGWLEPGCDEIAADLMCNVDDVRRILDVIQSFDPAGVAAQDLQECLLIQLEGLREEHCGNLLAENFVRHHFQDVAEGRVGKLARANGVSLEKTRQALEFIRSQCHPYPASEFRPPWATQSAAGRASIKPDVVLRRTEFGYEVEVLGTEPFLLGVNPTYRELYDRIRAGDAGLKEDGTKHVTEYVERAELFIRNIKQRRKTLRLITRTIVDLQQGFLETGLRTYIRPLTRTRVADMLAMHESTISRATAKKFVQLPNQEVVAYDIFFNPSLSIKMNIEEIIADEDPRQPVSDQHIVKLLGERGIDVARRTVVKYRDAQKILSSNRRRR